MENDFKREIGALINHQKEIIHIIEGEIVHTNFPPETINFIHKLSPGYIFAFTHIHPPHSFEMSMLDQNMLKTWAISFSPFPARMIVISEMSQVTPSYRTFRETCWLAQLEAKETWLVRGKKGSREVTIIKEWVKEDEVMIYNPEELPTENPRYFFGYERVLIEKSYDNQ